MQDLLDVQFSKHHYDDYTCPQCQSVNKSTVTPQVDLSTSPSTLVLLLKRYTILQGQFALKTETKIIPDRNIKMRSGSQWHAIDYTLRAVVCHLGGYGTGHYIAYVVHGNEIVKCDDDDIEITNLDQMEIYKQCYMLVYDKVETNVNLQTVKPKQVAVKNQMHTSESVPKMFSLLDRYKCMYKSLANCLRQCSSINHALQYFQKKKGPGVAAKQELLSDIINGRLLTKKWEDATSASTTVQTALKYIIDDIYQDTGSDMSFIDVHACFSLGISLQNCVHKKYSNAFVDVCNVANLTCNAIKNVISNQLSCKKTCTCNCKRDMIITCLPFTLALNLNAPLEIKILLSDFNVSNLIPNVPPNMDVVYRTNSFIIKKEDGTLFSLVKAENGFKMSGYNITDKSISLSNVESLIKNGNITLFLDKYDIGSCSIDVVPPEPIFNFSEPMQYYTNKTLMLCKPHMIGDTEINSEILCRVQNNTYWFNSGVIDAYMLLLKKFVFNKKIHILPAGWFNQKLFWNSDLEFPKLVYDAQDRVNWLEMDYILLPTNVLNCHWILFIMDLKRQLIIVADSNSSNEYHCAILQLVRYIGLHAHLSGNVVDFSQWDITYYHRLQGFPKQWDKSSCGPYICQMTKAIMCCKSFSFTPCTARNTIARELATGNLMV